MYSTLIIYCLKGVIQAFILHSLANKSCLWKFITALSDFLQDIKITHGIKEVERRFSRRVYINFAIQSFGIISFICMICVNYFLKNGFVELQQSEVSKTLSKVPFGINSTMLIPARSVGDVMMLIAWICPVVLCITLIHSLTYAFEEFYRYLDAKRSRVCTRAFLREIRQKFLRLSDLTARFDGMMSILLMFSYFFDIVMVCLVLNLIFFTYHDIVSRAVAAVWLILPTFTLITLSNIASKLYDTVRKDFSRTLHFTE